MAVRCSDSDSDAGSLEEFPPPAEHAEDTSAEQYAAGRDLQGVPWERLGYPTLCSVPPSASPHMRF